MSIIDKILPDLNSRLGAQGLYSDMLNILIENCEELEESASGRYEIEERYEPLFKKIKTSWEQIKELLNEQ